MRPPARLAAAMEILDSWLAGAGPADRLIAAWGRTHRFAGRKDRAAIADRVYAALRRKASAAHLMGAETGRALVLGTLALEDGLSATDIEADLSAGVLHAPASLTAGERAAIAQGLPKGAPPWVTGNYPAWLHSTLEAAFGSELPAEMAALAARAPLDVRVNTLKATRDEGLKCLADEGLVASPCRFAPTGLRLPAGAPVSRTRAYLDGIVEVQDEGSQLVSLLAGAKPGMTVIDLAAGAGGKTLALGATMGNWGQLVATDTDAARLADLPLRAARAGLAIARWHIIRDWDGEGADPDFSTMSVSGRADLVLVDAPCSGSGTWRRDPESKWRLDGARLATLTGVQARLLDRAAALVRPGGRLVYATCSILPVENEVQIEAFVRRRPQFAGLAPDLLLAEAAVPAISCRSSAVGINFSTRTSGTDGFFIAGLSRTAGG